MDTKKKPQENGTRIPTALLQHVQHEAVPTGAVPDGRDTMKGFLYWYFGMPGAAG